MALRFYLVPKAGTGASLDPMRPKYIGDIAEVAWRAMDYGLEDTFLVAADVTAGQHSTISANADVISVPQNLDAQVGANLATVQAALESVNLPASWVTATHTYRRILRTIAKVILLIQRYRGREQARFFLSGITLSTTIGSLTNSQRTALSTAATSLGLDVSGVTGAMTIRQAFTEIADQLPTPSLFGEAF